MKEGSREGAKTRSVEKLAALVVDTGYRIHVEVGPGLLESVYEAVLAELLMRQGLRLERQLPIPVTLTEDRHRRRRRPPPRPKPQCSLQRRPMRTPSGPACRRSTLNGPSRG